jgi:pimeloyl-ACP methyl ester carboxylesterase
MSQVSMRKVTVPGGQLPVWVREGDSSAAALVFLHYWGGSHRTFEPVINRLVGGNTAVSYDHRGWGEARELAGPYGIEQLADDALDVVRELGLRRYVLAGHSMGGKAAMLAASRRPEGLAGLALIAPAPPRPVVSAERAEEMSHAYDSPETVDGTLQYVLTHQPLTAELRQQAVTDSLAAGDEARLDWPRHGVAADISAGVGAIEVPVLVIAGEHDRVDPPASLEANLLPFIPGARMAVIEGTGHLSPLEAPSEVASQLSQFAAALAPVAG